MSKSISARAEEIMQNFGMVSDAANGQLAETTEQAKQEEAALPELGEAQRALFLEGAMAAEGCLAKEIDPEIPVGKNPKEEDKKKKVVVSGDPQEAEIVEGSRGEKRLMRVADAAQRDSKTGTPQTDPKLAAAEKKLTRKQGEGIARIKKGKRALEQKRHAELDTDEYPGTSVPREVTEMTAVGSIGCNLGGANTSEDKATTKGYEDSYDSPKEGKKKKKITKVQKESYDSFLSRTFGDL